MDVFRIGDDMICVDGLMVHNPEGSDHWFSCNNKLIGSVRLQALYLYLHNEEKSRMRRFHVYCNNIIKELIYN
jgi:hypothetical protein